MARIQRLVVVATLLFGAQMVLPLSADGSTAEPIVTAVSPPAGGTAGGGKVVVSGSGFDPDAAVTFGGTSSAAVTVTSPKRLVAIAPAHEPGQVDMQVVTAAGTSPVVDADTYTYVSAPTIAAVSPSSGGTAGGNTVTISGTDFSAVRSVKFGTTPARGLMVLSSTTITVPAPSHLVGLVDVRVATAYGISARTATDRYRFLSPYAWHATQAPSPEDSYSVPTDVSCTSDGNCVASGNRSPQGTGVFWTESNGVWSDPVDAPLPPGVAAGSPNAVSGVACVSSTRCAAIGQYTADDGSRRTEVLTIADGVWSAVDAPLPADADPTGLTFALPGRVSCSPTGTCVAGGIYRTSDGAQRPVVWTLTDAAWTAVRLPLPGRPEANPQAEIYGIDCGPTGTCVAGGDYQGNGSQGALWIEADGHWTTTKAPLPSGVDRVLVHVTSVACGNQACVAVGGYDYAGGELGLLWTLTDGTWTVTRAPAGPHPGGQIIQSVACSTTCTAVGYQYFVPRNPGPTNSYSIYWTLADGTWTAKQAPRPTNVPARSSAQMISISCTSDSFCAAAGAVSVNGQTLPLLWTEESGRWTATQPAPPNDAPLGANTFAAIMSCAGTDSCAAIGQSIDVEGHPLDGTLWTLEKAA